MVTYDIHSGVFIDMVTKNQVLDALQTLKDPKIEKNLVDLNLIRDILIRDGKVHLTVVLTQLDDEIKAYMQKQVGSRLQALGVKEPHIRIRQITDFEMGELQNRLQNGNTEAPAAKEEGKLDSMQARRQAEMKAAGMPKLLSPGSKVHFIAVASGKGGVGKSTVSVNLAVALARQGKKTGIIDADIYGFSVPDMMGIEEAPKLVNDRIIPVERFGVSVISMGFFVQDNAPVIWRGPMLGKMLTNFFNEVEWDSDLEYMILDLPPGTGDVALDVHQMIPQSKELLVTTPHATAAFVAARAGAMALNTNHELLGIVENMSYYECGQCGQKEYVFGRGGGAKLAEEMHTELIAQIPLGAPDNHPSEPDYSPSIYKEDSTVGQIFLDLAARVIQKVEG